jgi:DNA anti-recombination protein RmuC
MMSITATLTVDQLLRLPGEAVMILVLDAKAPPEFLQAAYDAEAAGKGRWPVLNHLRQLLKKA